MNFKRKKPRNSRAGCKLCKPWKISGIARTNEIFEQRCDHKRRIFAIRDIREAETMP